MARKIFTRKIIWILGAALLLTASPAWAQVNFKPLERGDFEEKNEIPFSVRGLEVGLEYALLVENLEYPGLPAGGEGTFNRQDIRLELKTVFHQDVSLHLMMGPTRNDMENGSLRAYSEGEPGQRLTDSQPTQLGLRESYLRYRFNPNSAMLLGKHELSVADKRGKIFNAVVPAYTFDCQVGTWCMPFGVGFIGSQSGDAIYHWGLQYNAWNYGEKPLKNKMEVEVYRVIYLEHGVPLATNLGPGSFDPENPDIPLEGQLTDSGVPVYYDTRKDDYYGVRMEILAGWFFWDLDLLGHKGSRVYHSPSAEGQRYKVRAKAVESHLGVRWEGGRVGMHFLFASGDPYKDPASQESYLRHLEGYHEITPGSYKGTRLYFNGGDSQVDDGAGLGHSINNTGMLGLTFQVDDRATRQVSFKGGLYRLRYNHAVPGKNGNLIRDIGVEWDNQLTWHVHKALRFQFEANALKPGPAFRLNDYSPPSDVSEYYIQALARLVYSF